MPNNWFTARYSQECEWCAEEIEAGDACKYVNGVVLHYNCAQEAEAEKRKQEWEDA